MHFARISVVLRELRVTIDSYTTGWHRRTLRDRVTKLESELHALESHVTHLEELTDGTQDPS